MADKKKVWLVQTDITTGELEDHLNEMAENGYTVHSLTRDADDYWVVVAYDAARIMEKSTESMIKQLADLQAAPSK